MRVLLSKVSGCNWTSLFPRWSRKITSAQLQSVCLKTHSRLEKILVGVGGNIPSKKRTRHNPSCASVGTDRCRISYLLVGLPKCFQLLRGLYCPFSLLVFWFKIVKARKGKIRNCLGWKGPLRSSSPTVKNQFFVFTVFFLQPESGYDVCTAKPFVYNRARSWNRF